MKKIGLLVMSLVLALGMLGVGYAMWSEELTITGTVTTGTVDVEFSEYTNDAGPHGTAGAGGFTAGNLDPEVPGTWTPGAVAAHTDADPSAWTGTRSDKNVGSTDCTLTTNPDILTITIDNAYPCYFGSVLADISNVGSIPVKVISFELIEVSKDALVTTLDPVVALTPCTWYYVDVDAGPPPTVRPSATPPPAGFLAGEDFSFHLSDYADPLYDLVQIDPGEVGYVDITVHLEQDAEMLTDYDFSILITVCNWNEPGT